MPFVRSAYIRFITSSVPRSPPRVAELRVVGHGKAVFLRGSRFGARHLYLGSWYIYLA